MFGLNEESAKAMPPPGLHPLVRVHSENGRKALYLNPVRMESIEGMGDNEAQALIGELMDHATQQKYEYRHHWRQGDWVIWDNRSVMHQANADYGHERTALSVPADAEGRGADPRVLIETDR